MHCECATAATPTLSVSFNFASGVVSLQLGNYADLARASYFSVSFLVTDSTLVDHLNTNWRAARSCKLNPKIISERSPCEILRPELGICTPQTLCPQCPTFQSLI